MKNSASLTLWSGRFGINGPFASQFLRRNGAWIGLFVLTALLVFLTDGSFLSERNLTNLMRQTAVNGTLAAGMTLVILTGGIDLSVGSLVALVGVVVGLSQTWLMTSLGGGPQSAFVSFVVAVVGGGLLGSANGGLIAWLRIPPFVITLGMMVIARGLALILTNGTGISPMGETMQWVGSEYLSFSSSALFILFLLALMLLLFRSRHDGKGGFGWGDAVFPGIIFLVFGYAFLTYKGFPVSVAIFAIAALSTTVLLTRTVLGRAIYSVGSNETAAFWAGVPVQKVKFFVYTAMGSLAGVAAYLLTARLNAAVPTAGQLFELDAIAAVVIGGTSLKGGSGTLMGAFAGALMIGVLNNGMDLLLVPSFYQMVFKGLIIIGAVALDRNQRSEVA